MRLTPAETSARVSNRARKAIHDQRVNVRVQDVLNFADHPSHARGGDSALEHRELNPFSVLLANPCHPAQTGRAFAVRGSDVIGDEDIHGSGRHYIGGICRKVSSQMAGKQRGLNQG